MLAAEDTLSHAVLAAVFIPSHAVERFVDSVVATPDTVVEIPSQAVLAAEDKLSHAVLAAVLIPSQAVERPEANALAAVVTVVEIPSQTVDATPFIPSHAPDQSPEIRLITVLMIP